MESIALDATFHNYVEYWWLYLVSLIEECRRAQRRPVLIALSRKMPRFIDWFRDIYSPTRVQITNVDILEAIELTTEIAIPFLFTSQDCSDCEFIILDDLIIRGTTLALTSNLLFALTGRLPRVSCIAMREEVKVRPMVEMADFERIPVLSQDRIDRFADQISSKVEEWVLPVDMEFPVFKIPSGFIGDSGEEIFLDTERHAIANFKNRCYVIGNQGNRFSVDLSIGVAAGKDTDFTKVRFFLNGDDEVIFEVFSPMILSYRLLESSEFSPFSNAESSHDPEGRFEKLWDRTTWRIREEFQEVVYLSNLTVAPSMLWDEIIRSLAVWANYLYSLIAYTRNRISLIPEEYLPTVHLSVKDLSLLIGNKLASSLRMELEQLVADNVYVLSTREKNTDVAWNLCPRHLEEMIEANKITSLLGGGSPEGVAEKIFRFMHYTNPKLQKWSERSLDWRKNLLGETYFSLQDALYPLYTSAEYWTDLRAWVDAQIDAGRIVPKYDMVDDGGETYWRRFFHAGVRKFSDN